MVDIRDLAVIPRILLATDGAITHILEAYANEPIDLVRLNSSVAPFDGEGIPKKVMDADGEREFLACSLLQGRRSGRVFVHASTRVILDRLPPPVADELMESGSSILRLLLRNRIGSFRESVAEWEGADEHVAARLGIDPSEIQVGRTYQIVVGGRPVAWITEHFAKNGFPTPAPELAGSAP